MADAMPTKSDLGLRRVVLALDATVDFVPAIEMAAATAAAFGTALSALFFEDETLRRLASLPFAQQMDMVTARRSQFDEAELRAQSSLLERRMRRELARIAGLHELSWSFEALRTTISTNAVSLTEADLLVIAAASRPMASGLRIESAWWRMVGQVHRPLLLVPERPEVGGPVAAMYEATEAGQRTLGTSIRIARAGKRPLIVILMQDASAEEQSEIKAAAQAGDGKVTLHTLRPASYEALRALLLSSRATLLVVGRDGKDPAQPADLLRLSASSALLIV